MDRVARTKSCSAVGAPASGVEAKGDKLVNGRVGANLGDDVNFTESDIMPVKNHLRSEVL